ncbi:MAG: hypothetical protein H8Z69_05640 [Nanohaloarchaea archaeon]|nr:hypothetical protein [Candidatus Nanohaloarchaea archaeon]
MAAVVSAPASGPTHPLSQISPIDVDLDMEEQDLFNISELKISHGPVFDQNAIRGSGNAPTFVRFKSSGEIEFPGGRLDLRGNGLENISSIGSCGNSELIMGDGSCNPVSNFLTSDNWVDENGDTMTGPLDMGGNSIDKAGSVEVQNSLQVPVGEDAYQ